jgi:hypothetical protein
VLTAEDEIVVLMSDQRGGRYVGQAAEKRHSAALVAFLGAGMQPPPSTALLVRTLADARRAVATNQARGLAVERWLAAEVRVRGIRENAAVLAVLEMPGWRDETARAYRQEHPDRADVLSELLAVLD